MLHVLICRGGREDAPSTSASMGEAPPAPGLPRRPSKQSDQQELQVRPFPNCTALCLVDDVHDDVSPFDAAKHVS